jgi:hypothetical protein
MDHKHIENLGATRREKEGTCQRDWRVGVAVKDGSRTNQT